MTNYATYPTMGNTNEPELQPALITFSGRALVYIVFTLFVIGLTMAAYDGIRELTNDEPGRPGAAFIEVHDTAFTAPAGKAPTDPD